MRNKDIINVTLAEKYPELEIREEEHRDACRYKKNGKTVFCIDYCKKGQVSFYKGSGNPYKKVIPINTEAELNNMLEMIEKIMES